MSEEAADVPTSPSPFPRHNPFDRLTDEGEVSEGPEVPSTYEVESASTINPESEAIHSSSDGQKLTSQLLSEGLLAHLLPPLETTKDQLAELQRKQQRCQELFHGENQR